MQLHTLRFAAIGPFPEEHLIDFDALGASGLFLLEGPTGAGKSTILDAIVFALYGDVASTTSSSRARLHSDHAAPSSEPFSELVFETGHGIFRIRRTPEYERPKKRGGGTTRQQASVVLSRLLSLEEVRAPQHSSMPSAATAGGSMPNGELISVRVNEADQEIERVVGLTRAQFVQTVILPQGEFAAFLRADTEARQAVLQRLFGTHVYEAMQTQLESMRRESRRAVDLAVAQAGTSLEVLAAAASQESMLVVREAVPSEGVPELMVQDLVDVPVSEASAWLDALVGAVAARAVRAADTARDLAVEVSGAVEADAAATVAIGRVTRAVELRSIMTSLEAEAGDRAAWAEAIDRAGRAGAVATAVMGAQRAEADLTARLAETSARWTEASDALAEELAQESAGTLAEYLVGAPVESAEGLIQDAVRARIVELRDVHVSRADAVEEWVVGERALAELESEAQAVREELAAARVRAAELAAADQESATRQAEWSAALRVASEASAMLPDCARRVDLLSDLAKARRAQGAGIAEVARAEADLQSAAAEASRLVEVETTLRHRRLAEFAGTLAAELTRGEPCPVCGSLEHPRPAELVHDAVSDEDIDRAERERADAERWASTAHGSSVAAQVRLREANDLAVRTADLLREYGSGDAGPEELGASGVGRNVSVDSVAEENDIALALVQARARLEELTARSSDLHRIDSLREQERLAAAERSEQRATTLALVARLEERQATDRARIEQETNALAQARGDFPSAAAHHENLRMRVVVLGELIAAIDRARSAVLVTDERAAELRTAMRTHEIPDVETVAVWTLSREAVTDLEERVRSHEAALRAARAEIRSLQLEDPGAEGESRAAAELSESELSELLDRWRSMAEGRRERLTEGSTALRELERAATLAADEARRIEVATRAARDALAEADRLRDADEPIRRMAALAVGTADTDRQITLSTYVLMRRFEDVVAAANDRLAQMSDGRYELARTDAREQSRAGGARRTGLGLRVIDHVTDKEREPKTLSGGETFYVSLCLALGLADVVVAEAGGLDLGTLFVDEGFGTLDQETLDQVLTELGALRDGGRVVGIVSHVEELKTRIAERIEVRRRQDGSSTVRVRA